MAPEIEELAPGTTDLVAPLETRNDYYDRSSLVGDFLVMIADQTEEEYLRRAPENKTCEYIDGTVYLPSPAELWHQFDIQLLVVILEGFTADRQLGHVLTGPAALKIRDGCYLEPDLFVIPYEANSEFQGFFRVPPVLLVVEVLSRSTREHDLNRKAELYREAGVLEIWFLDLREQLLIVHRLTADGYEVEQLEAGVYRSRAVPGFWLDVSWLWARPRPNVMACLRAILAEPSA